MTSGGKEADRVVCWQGKQRKLCISISAWKEADAAVYAVTPLVWSVVCLRRLWMWNNIAIILN